jgi:predicted hotdog family 3-hydroxylacyl-ACP dehydratase
VTTRLAQLPPIEAVVPHRAPLVLLDAVLAHAPDETTCAVFIRDGSPLRVPGGPVPGWVGLEYMAQCIAAHAGLIDRAAGRPPAIGFLLGARDVRFHAAGYLPGQVLHVCVRRLWGQGRLGAFACSIRDSRTNALLAQGTVSAFLTDRPDHADGRAEP